MKKTLVLLSLMICCATLVLSCQNGEQQKNEDPSTISNDYKQTAEKEISARIEEIIRGAKALNVDTALDPYSNDPNFKIVNPDATVANFAIMKKLQAESFNTLAVLNFTTIKQDFTFIAKGLVMCTWTGRNEFEFKTGEKMIIDPYVGSMLFKKTNNEWKIIYAHETTAPPVADK